MVARGWGRKEWRVTAHGYKVSPEGKEKVPELLIDLHESSVMSHSLRPMD